MKLSSVYLSPSGEPKFSNGVSAASVFLEFAEGKDIWRVCKENNLNRKDVKILLEEMAEFFAFGKANFAPLEGS